VTIVSAPLSIASPIKYSNFRVLFPPVASPVQSSRLIHRLGPEKLSVNRVSGSRGVGL